MCFTTWLSGPDRILLTSRYTHTQCIERYLICETKPNPNSLGHIPVTITTVLIPKQLFEEVRTSQNVLAFQKCPHSQSFFVQGNTCTQTEEEQLISMQL